METQSFDQTQSGAPLGLLARSTGAAIAGDDSVVVRGVQQDSRRVVPGDLFVALDGATTDGARFIPNAKQRGAVAVVLRRGRQVDTCGLAVLEVDEPRVAMAELARLVYGDPTQQLKVIGITGTNGKTTTAHLVHTAIEGAGGRIAVIGTLGHRFEQWEAPGIHTSPESDALQRLTAEFVSRGADHLVMEVSSIGLAAERLAGVSFDVAAFTNLTQDHLDYHGTMEAYAQAKDRLFFDFRPGACIVDVDDAHGASLAERIEREGHSRLLRVSRKGASSADIRAVDIQETLEGICFTAEVGATKQFRVSAPLVGEHNIANLLLTIGIAVALELDPARAIDALASLPQVPGRLERCDSAGVDDLVVLVDYAHTPDALEHALKSLRPLFEGQLWCVFGCGGDRDASKRAPMGRVVARHADHAIVTNDNPRSESPEAIAKAVLAGITDAVERDAAKATVQTELDRSRAIHEAVRAARPGDVVLIAGKGHEPYQIIGDQTLAFDDRDVARGALLARRGGVS